MTHLHWICYIHGFLGFIIGLSSLIKPLDNIKNYGFSEDLESSNGFIVMTQMSGSAFILSGILEIFATYSIKEFCRLRTFNYGIIVWELFSIGYCVTISPLVKGMTNFFPLFFVGLLTLFILLRIYGITHNKCCGGKCKKKCGND